MHRNPFLVMFLFVIGCAAPAQAQQQKERLISVSGTSEIGVSPDYVELDLAVVTSAKTLAAAKSQLDQRIRRVLDLTSTIGIDPKDVQTSRVRMGPDREDGKLLGYEARQYLRIDLRDLAKYETLLTQLLDAGVTQVDSVDFEVSDVRSHMDRARILALRAAREKASAMANEMGLTLGKPRRIDETVPSYGATANITSGFQSETSASPSAATSKVVIRARVFVTFDVE